MITLEVGTGLSRLLMGLAEKYGRMNRDGVELKSESLNKLATKLHTRVFNRRLYFVVMWNNFTGILKIGHALNWYVVLNLGIQNLSARKMAEGQKRSTGILRDWETRSRKDGIIQYRKENVKSTYLTSNTFSWFVIGRIVSSSSLFLLI